MIDTAPILAACVPRVAHLPAKERDQRLGLCRAALEWLGTPYHSHGRVMGSGVDCGTILIETFSSRDLIPDFDPGDYAIDWHLHRNEELYLETLERFARQKLGNYRVEKADKSFPTMAQAMEVALPGDVALFKYGRTLSHSSIILAAPTMIHAYLGRGVVLDDLDNGEYPERFVGLWSVWEGA